jgi:hypothetical protein
MIAGRWPALGRRISIPWPVNLKWNITAKAVEKALVICPSANNNGLSLPRWNASWVWAKK